MFLLLIVLTAIALFYLTFVGVDENVFRVWFSKYEKTVYSNVRPLLVDILEADEKTIETILKVITGVVIPLIVIVSIVTIF